ncbi:MAG TPA: LuxR C-terminal-related transcriptional regulator, partial [Phycisphaerae bacterium]|nr:LuxR C-terminal-related transcriptional regulator [Phycisphaerae bacterium]
DASRTLGQPMVVLRVSGGGTATEPFDDSLCSLSKREIEVSSLVSAGLSNKQIAKSLFLSLATVKDHVHRILSKTGLANRAAIAAAYQKRLTAG